VVFDPLFIKDGITDAWEKIRLQKSSEQLTLVRKFGTPCFTKGRIRSSNALEGGYKKIKGLELFTRPPL
jgi:hypothetical protein